MREIPVLEPIYPDVRDLLQIDNLTKPDAIAEREKPMVHLIGQVCWTASTDGPISVGLMSREYTERIDPDTY